jgi:hypothetical protein
MVVVERQRLLAVARVLRVVQIENEALWRTGKTGDVLLDEGLADAVVVNGATTFNGIYAPELRELT